MRGGVKRVITPESAVLENYDVIIVATKYTTEIYQQAKELKFDISKFIFVYTNYFQDINVSYALAEKIFSPRYIDIIKNRYHIISGMQQDEIKSSRFSCKDYHTLAPLTQSGWKDGMYADDYNRIRTFELVVDEIISNNVEGAVAELGVFQGKFAKYINGAFQDRKCYLFDTFEGFRESEAIKEKAVGNCGNVLIERCKDTSMEKVLRVMPFPNSIICKKGLFPESLDGLEERFAFVSIDVDFEDSIYEGMTYFYPRLNRGGYIFVHDYNSCTLHGVRRAIQRYEKAYNITMAKVPIPDLAGTLVITKG